MQVTALSQRRSEQANASGAAAPTPKARAPSPGSMLSSAHSKRSSGVMFADGGPGLELTDAFEELQAFFEGGTLADGPTPTSFTKVGAPVCRGYGGGEELAVFPRLWLLLVVGCVLLHPQPANHLKKRQSHLEGVYGCGCVRARVFYSVHVARVRAALNYCCACRFSPYCTLPEFIPTQED